MIGQTISRYRILERIGAGGMGEVYLAEDTDLRRRVAIKFLPGGYSSDPEVLKRFKREARAAATLEHPNIITIYEVAEHQGRPFIAMAYVEGKPLSAAIQGGPLPIDTLLAYAIQIAEGLGKAHEAGVVHRDVKPDNILIDSNDNVKILDFGLAKLAGVTKLTNEASTLGTLYYMSPELARSSDVDHRSDLFSLGTILYEMIAGQLPFQGDHPAAVTYSITTEEPHPLARYNSKASPELQRIVSKALAKDPDERYQSAADLLADLKRELRLSVSGASVDSIAAAPAAPGRRARRFIIPASIAAVAAAFFLIFKPFTFEIAPDRAVVAAENILAIMYFENKTDPADEERLGEIVTDLLITDLSESSSLNVLSSQRLYDLLKLEGKEGMKSIDRATSTDVARRAGAKWMLLGSILRAEPDMVVTSQLVSVESGTVASSQYIQGQSGDDVFTIADKLSQEIRSDLALPTASSAAQDSGIKVSTESAEAYRYYLEGIEFYYRYNYEKAEQSLLEAIRHDSTFAMAYFRLSYVGDDGERRRFIEKARQHADNVTRHEKLWIDARYAQRHREPDAAQELLEKITDLYPEDKEAYYRLGRLYLRQRKDLEEAVRCLRKTIEIDPAYKVGYNQLAYAYDVIGDFDQSIWAINKYIELAPNEPNPYDTRGDLYAWRGKVDEAIESYRKAVQIRPDFELSTVKLGHMYRAKRDYAAAEATYRQLLDSENPELRSYARNWLAGIFAYQGKFTLALEQYDRGIAADRLENNVDEWNHWDKILLKGQIYELRGEYDKALAVMEDLPSRERGDERSVADPSRCEWSALSGDFERANRIAGILKADPEEQRDFHWCAGMIAFAEERFDDAVDHFERLAGGQEEIYIWNRFRLARAYQEANRLSEAVRVYEAALKRIDEAWGDDPTTAVTVHYYAARAYESSGWNDRAIERYEEFLDIWKGADPGIEIVEDAKRRLERLRRGS